MAHPTSPTAASSRRAYWMRKGYDNLGSSF